MGLKKFRIPVFLVVKCFVARSIATRLIIMMLMIDDVD